MVKQGSKNSRKLHSGKEEILEHKCGFLCKSSTMEDLRFIVSEEAKFASTAKALGIWVEPNRLVQFVEEQAKWLEKWR